MVNVMFEKLYKTAEETLTRWRRALYFYFVNLLHIDGSTVTKNELIFLLWSHLLLFFYYYYFFNMSFLSSKCYCQYC